MDKKLLNEDIQNMRYLFGYKPGRVISEQNINEFEYPEEESGMRKQNMQNFEKFVDKLAANKNSEGQKVKGPKKHYGSFDDKEWMDDMDRPVDGDFDFDFDEEKFNDYPSFKEKHPDSKWFGGEKYFDYYKKQHDKPFKVRTRKGEMDEDYDDDDEDFNDMMESRYDDDSSFHRYFTLKNKSARVVRNFLNSLSTEFIETKFITLSNCEYADFSGIDICGLPKLAYIRLPNTKNNFEEQGYECVIDVEEDFYQID